MGARKANVAGYHYHLQKDEGWNISATSSCWSTSSGLARGRHRSLASKSGDRNEIIFARLRQIAVVIRTQRLTLRGAFAATSRGLLAGQGAHHESRASAWQLLPRSDRRFNKWRVEEGRRSTSPRSTVDEGRNVPAARARRSPAHRLARIGHGRVAGRFRGRNAAPSHVHLCIQRCAIILAKRPAGDAFDRRRRSIRVNCAAQSMRRAHHTLSYGDDLHGKPAECQLRVAR